MSKTLLITGASTGFGKHLAEEALKQGYQVIATARQPETLQYLKDTANDKILMLRLDVTDRSSIKEAFNLGLRKFGKIDVLVNNAGFGMIGAVEEFSECEIQQQFDTNFFGALWTIQEALPYMRSQKSGHIINISSVAGFVGYPGSALYAASKHALEGLSQGLEKEVSSLGIYVTMVNPGPFRTNFAGSSLKIASKKIEAYGDSVHIRQENLKNNLHGNQAGDPLKAAKAILNVVRMVKPPFTLPLGEMAFREIPNRLKQTLDEIEAVKSIGLPTDYTTD